MSNFQLEYDASHVAYLTIGIGKVNAFGSSEINELIGLLQELTAQSGPREKLRAVVLKGGSKTFVGGANIKEMVTLDNQTAQQFITALYKLCEAVRAVPVPVIAAIDGWCLGAGVEIIAACDIRIASPNAHFAMPEVRMGIPSVIHAALLPQMIGSGRARWWLLTGEDISAATALQWGLIDVLAESGSALNEAVEHCITSITAASPQVIRSQKQLLNAWEHTSLAEAIKLTIPVFGAAFDTGEPTEHMNAFLEHAMA